jgi:hypothetical protein
MLQMGANPALGLAPCACVDEYLVENAHKLINQNFIKTHF